jgi:hypothetical protein
MATSKKRSAVKLKDPKGGLTAAGRKRFAEKDGSHLKPGVTGPADTPEKMKRKGSFLRRHYADPRGPVEKDGKPTRLALAAHAWGEPVPKTAAAVRKLAAKGTGLLKKYQKSQVKPAAKKRKK